MKSKWNINPAEAVTIARLLSDLEGASYILECLDEVEDLQFINDMKRKYYKEYFKKIKE